MSLCSYTQLQHASLTSLYLLFFLFFIFVCNAEHQFHPIRDMQRQLGRRQQNPHQSNFHRCVYTAVRFVSFISFCFVLRSMPYALIYLYYTSFSRLVYVSVATKHNFLGSFVVANQFESTISCLRIKH